MITRYQKEIEEYNHSCLIISQQNMLENNVLIERTSIHFLFLDLLSFYKIGIKNKIQQFKIMIIQRYL